MNPLSWFRCAAATPSWIEPAVLATRLERDHPLLVLDVRGPDEFTGPLGHIRGATNIPLVELPAHLPTLVLENRPLVVVCKTDRRSSWQHSSSRRPGCRMFRSCAAGWNSGECSAYRQAEKRVKEAARARASLVGRGNRLGERNHRVSRSGRCPPPHRAGTRTRRSHPCPWAHPRR